MIWPHICAPWMGHSYVQTPGVLKVIVNGCRWSGGSVGTPELSCAAGSNTEGGVGPGTGRSVPVKSSEPSGKGLIMSATFGVWPLSKVTPCGLALGKVQLTVSPALTVTTFGKYQLPETGPPGVPGAMGMSAPTCTFQVCAASAGCVPSRLDAPAALSNASEPSARPRANGRRMIGSSLSKRSQDANPRSPCAQDRVAFAAYDTVRSICIAIFVSRIRQVLSQPYRNAILRCRPHHPGSLAPARRGPDAGESAT